MTVTLKTATYWDRAGSRMQSTASCEGLEKAPLWLPCGFNLRCLTSSTEALSYPFLTKIFPLS